MLKYVVSANIKHGVYGNRSISVDLILDIVDESDGVVFKDNVAANGSKLLLYRLNSIWFLYF